MIPVYTTGVSDVMVIVRMCRGAAGDAQVLLAGILNNMERMLGVLVQDGFAPLESAYLNAWLHSRQQVPRWPQSLCCSLNMFYFSLLATLEGSSSAAACDNTLLCHSIASLRCCTLAGRQSLLCMLVFMRMRWHRWCWRKSRMVSVSRCS